jgi:hypothetical protein
MPKCPALSSRRTEGHILPDITCKEACKITFLKLLTVTKSSSIFFTA